MISELLKKERMASNSMMLASIGLHLAALITIIIMSYSFSSPTKIVGPVVSNVKLVESGASRVELARPETPMAEPSIIPLTREFAEPATAHTPNQERLTSSFSEAKPAPNLQLQKRKKPTQRIPETKTVTNKKTPAPKEPDNSKYLENRLSELRSKMREKSSEARPSENSLTSQAGSSSKAGASRADAELLRWFELVKNRVNTHWSLLGDQTKLDKITVVGVQITEDGKLVDASIDSSSGDKLFDNSALRAVFHAAPFPPIPHEVVEKIKQSGGLALRFTPGGMQ